MGFIIEKTNIYDFVSPKFNSYAFIAPKDELVTLYTTMLVREDDISLYGFTDKASLALFKLLLTVSGIGAKAALAILSVGSVSAIKQAIVFEDVDTIQMANGVGKKTAQRVVLELKDKLDKNEELLKITTEVQKDNTVTEIKADRITYDRETEMLFAEGNVEISTKDSSSGGETTTATTLLLNTSTLEGVFDNGRVVQTQSDALNLPSGSTLIVYSDIFGKGFFCSVLTCFLGFILSICS